MPVLKEIFDRKLECRRCLTSDIDPHFDQIKHWIPEDQHAEFKTRMALSVNENHAWCSENTFLYYTKENERLAHGVAIFGMNNPVEMLSLFTGVFYFSDRETCMLRFALHPGKMIQEYKSLLTVSSMMRAHANPNHPLMIRVDHFRQKMIKLIDKEIKK